MAIAWTDDLNTGIEVIDRQHRMIVDYINALDAAGQQNDRGIVGRVLDELVHYTVAHFTFEELLQVRAGYAEAAAHKAVHAMFIRRVARYEQRYRSGEDILVPLHAMLKTWLVHHIKRDDAAYVASLRPNIEKVVDNARNDGWLHRTLKSIFG